MKTGTITSVHKDTDADKISVTVQADIGQEYRRIPFVTSAPGIYYIPTVGEHVVVYDRGDGTRAAMHPKPAAQSPPAVPDISSGEYGIVTDDGAFVLIRNDGSIVIDGKKITVGDSDQVVIDGSNVTVGNGGEVHVDGGTIKFGAGGKDIITDVSANTTTDADGHVTSVSLDITRSSVTETE